MERLLERSMMDESISFIDLFAGGGGTSTGAFSVPGVKVVAAVNHDDIAIKTHAANHPETIHFREDLWVLDEKRLPKCDVLWASLECTNHSKAKGGKEKNVGSFTLGNCLPRYIQWCKPMVIWIENVPEFIRWGELKDGKRVKEKEGEDYRRWIQSIKDLGYTNYERRFLNAADYGCPTRRVRYFGVFTLPGVPVVWPKPTHAEKDNIFGLPKWVPCKDYINLNDEGNSIFGREFNENISKAKRHALSENTLRRIAGGIRKFAPEVYFIMKYYGTGTNCHSINEPLHTIRTKESHALIKIEKKQFIQDHCHTSSYQHPDEPLRPQLTRQTKQLITIERKFYTRALTNDYANQPLDKPAPTITTFGSDSVVTVKAQFVSAQYNSNGTPEANNQSIEMPLGSPTTKEKFQFITAYFNSSDHPETQNQSIQKPLNTILTSPNKKALVTTSLEGDIDFDVKMRFLTEDELAAIMGFPKGYFKRPGLKLNRKQIIKMVGNAVPVGMAKALIESIVPEITTIKRKMQVA